MTEENLRIRFGQWVRQEREKQELSRKECAKRVEDWLQSLSDEELHQFGKEDGGKAQFQEKPMRTYTHWAWSQIERRREAGDTIQRKTCRQVAVGLNLPFEVVYAQAGFDKPHSKLPESPIFLDYESMPMETQKKFLALPSEKQRLICSVINAF